MFKRSKNKDLMFNAPNNEQKDSASFALSKSLEENINNFKQLFKDDDTFIVRPFENEQNTDIKCCIIFIAEMIDNAIVNDNIIKPVVLSTSLNNKSNALDKILNHVLMSNNVEKTSSIDKLIQSVVRGDTVVFVEGFNEALVICTIGWQTRSITEPEGERVIRGPREGFTESLLMNLTMIRRRLSTNNLKFKFRVLGKQSKTKICICYIEGIVNHKILDELNMRLDKIDIDGITGSGTIVELIKDSPLSPFKTIGGTERPDVVSGKLLEGRIAIVVDGTPFVLTAPYIFIEYFQSSEDYYINFYYSSINRLLRILSFIITLSIPAFYIALASFHQEMAPTQFIRSISASRQDVPFPTAIEMIILLFIFEIIRETGTRMPAHIGQALSIVGALVLGQAAVEARLVSAPAVIVVALTAITGLATPKLKGVEVMLRVILILLSSIIGLYGFIFGIMGILIHLFDMRSFGVPYMLTLTSFQKEDLKDTAIRVPWFYLKYRPKFIAPNNRIRNNSGGKNR